MVFGGWKPPMEESAGQLDLGSAYPVLVAANVALESIFVLHRIEGKSTADARGLSSHETDITGSANKSAPSALKPTPQYHKDAMSCTVVIIAAAVITVISESPAALPLCCPDDPERELHKATRGKESVGPTGRPWGVELQPKLLESSRRFRTKLLPPTAALET
ncbi:hypothetical protein J6590_024580 [Homalodisca vitripennis]|nr:hypothetical protein J6590_024580 [Homalodisca vitripennis]